MNFIRSSIIVLLFAGMIILMGCTGKSDQETPENSNLESEETQLEKDKTVDLDKKDKGAEVRRPTIPQAEKTPLGELDLKFSIQESSNGFQLEFAEGHGLIDRGTELEGPNQDLIVHDIRRTEHNPDNEIRYRRDAVVVNPVTQDVKVFPLTNAQITDDYSTDSITNILGFINDETIIYIAAHSSSSLGRPNYNIETLNVHTGVKEILFANEPPNVEPDFYHSNINLKNNTLVINSFSEGHMWVYDLLNKEVNLLEPRFPSDWPYSAVIKSPDLELFWYHNHLYDLGGKEREPIEENVEQSSISWSPDSQYSVFHYILENNPKNYIDGGEFGVIAPQGLILLDRNGKPIRSVEVEETDMHVEAGGWLPERNTVILHYYQVDPGQDYGEQKVNSQYVSLDIKSGERRKLRAAPLESLISAERVELYPRYDQPFFVDWTNGTYWKEEKRAEMMGTLLEDKYIWKIVNFDHNPNLQSEFVLYDTDTGKTNSIPFSTMDSHLYLNKWILTFDHNKNLMQYELMP